MLTPGERRGKGGATEKQKKRSDEYRVGKGLRKGGTYQYEEYQERVRWSKTCRANERVPHASPTWVDRDYGDMCSAANSAAGKMVEFSKLVRT